MVAFRVLLLLEWGVFTAAFLCGVVAAASINLFQAFFGGQCMLYGSVSYELPAEVIGVVTSSSPSLCYFVTLVSGSVGVVAFSMSVFLGYSFCMDGEVRRRPMWSLVMGVVITVTIFFLFVNGCILNIGRKSLCDLIVMTVPNITSCEEAQRRKWATPYQGDRFYNVLHKAETANVVNFCLWVTLLVLAMAKRNQDGGLKLVVGDYGGFGGYGGPAGGLFDDAGVTAAETEPFFSRLAKPQVLRPVDSVEALPLDDDGIRTPAFRAHWISSPTP